MKGGVVGAHGARAFCSVFSIPCLRPSSPQSCSSAFSSQRPLQQQPQREKDDYYLLLLSSPLPSTASSTRSSGPSLPSSLSSSKPNPEPRIIFGSRLAGPAAREREGWAATRPREPDNCCMSGCVNCVWDAYREEVEEWAARRRMVEAQEKGREGVAEGEGGDADEATSRELFEQVPVGIREFMALEKRLREVKEKREKGKIR